MRGPHRRRAQPRTRPGPGCGRRGRQRRAWGQRGRWHRGRWHRIGAPPRWAQACPRCGAPRDGQFCESCGYDFAAPASGRPATARTAAARTATARPGGAGRGPAGHVRPLAGRFRPQAPCLRGPVPSAPGSAAATPAAPPGAAWTAVVSADRAYYDSVHAAGGPDAAGIEFPAYSPQRRFPLDRAEIRIGRHSASSGISPEIDLSVPPADPGVSRLHAVLLRAADGSWAVVDPGSANGTAAQRDRAHRRPGRPCARR